MSVKEQNLPKQAPWRSVLRSTSSALLWLVILLIVGGMYLAINAKATTAGRDVLRLSAALDNAKNQRNELQATLAELLSPGRMIEIVSSLGFRETLLKDIIYVPFEGAPRDDEFEANHSESSEEEGSIPISPAYRETLVDWIEGWLQKGESE
ncbi:MAG: hypothetical protein GTO18_12280 [Anaerolineales bacterium]|nr:hypothetical protein [Anaerolineales bacterium]